jgi:bacteriocin-like protein
MIEMTVKEMQQVSGGGGVSGGVNGDRSILGGAPGGVLGGAGGGVLGSATPLGGAPGGVLGSATPLGGRGGISGDL